MPNRQSESLLGALTQTLVKSPVIRSIIPARIRHADKNDVILVRNNSIEINEVIKVFNKEDRICDAYLTHIAVKADFDSTIRAAKIFGRPRKYKKMDKALEGLYEIKNEDNTFPAQRSVYRPEIPPQILAITLESSKIVFLCTFFDFSGHLQWLSNCRVLPDYAQTYSKQLGEHIAVDPRSRAMAVAANEGSFVLYSLKSMGAYPRPYSPILIPFFAGQFVSTESLVCACLTVQRFPEGGYADQVVDRPDETGS